MINRLRIIGGEWRSRQIEFDDAPGLRPTPARVRETLFNWLQTDVTSSRCLDLFAGSGALGFEAASRGAASVIQVDNNSKTCQKLRENIAKLSATQIQVVQADAMEFLKINGEQLFDLVFLDPPFSQERIQPCCRQLIDCSRLAPYAKIYVESELNGKLDDMPANWRLLKQKTAGEVVYSLFQHV
jgi:16S rRNA (guanine966-N2)-methyltransferase